MMLLSATALALGLAAASPIEERNTPQTVHLTFHGGPASYSMAFPADGKVYPTNNNIAVNIIDAPDYNAIPQCTFYTPGEKALVGGITSDGVNQVIIGPPQPVTGVSCLGICIPVYGDCYRNGQYVGPCCNGFCAANKCRPWIQPS
ncbi:hypothetical protein B0T16DRAFT_410792 [Cercophora newfieldiana]|uniref:SSCRP protein n=1 Tax=Cercophora newfieldiana TaxID=92897 RepID=A0AA39YDF4_9PEZI|nr:hypothetical protein B0T16DRAFT_410792 [Cercophora newfieldiana]